jgi:hypothetical protein
VGTVAAAKQAGRAVLRRRRSSTVCIFKEMFRLCFF